MDFPTGPWTGCGFSNCFFQAPFGLLAEGAMPSATPIIITVYFVVIVAVGVALSGRVKSATDYLIAGRRLGLALTTASLAAVQIGAGIVMGGAETAAQHGLWPGVWYGLGCGGGLIVAGLLAAGPLRKQGGFVPIDFFASRFGERRWVRLWAWVSNVPSLIGIFAAQLMACASVLAGFGVDRSHAILGIGALILVSNTLSGMWGVVAVDFFQVAIIVIGIPLAAAAAVYDPASTGLFDLVSTPFVPPGMASRAVFLITPFLFSISVSYDAYIRYQAARSASVAKWACVLAGVLVIGVSFCAALIGAAGRQAFPELADDAVLSHQINSSLPAVAAGIVVAAMLAAAMSTANALLISIAGCFARDFYNKVLYPSRALDDLPRATLFLRLSVLGSLIVGVSVALSARGILDTIIIFAYPYMASMLVPLLGGLLWKRASAAGAFAAMATGGLIGVLAFLAGAPGSLHGLFNIDLALLIAFASSAVVLVVVSLATAPPADPRNPTTQP